MWAACSPTHIRYTYIYTEVSTFWVALGARHNKEMLQKQYFHSKLKFLRMDVLTDASSVYEEINSRRYFCSALFFFFDNGFFIRLLTLLCFLVCMKKINKLKKSITSILSECKTIFKLHGVLLVQIYCFQTLINIYLAI